MGIPKTPTKILAINGSWRAKKRSDEPKPLRAIPRRPAHLKGSARYAWYRITKQLDQMGVITLADKNAIARYCAIYGQWRACHKFMEKHGYRTITFDKCGNEITREHPDSRIARNLHADLLRLEREFGLTPSSRADLVANEPNIPENDKSEFFQDTLYQ